MIKNINCINLKPWNHEKIPEVGDIISLREFCYTNKYGGTDTNNTSNAKFKVIKVWDDYECGLRGWCTPLDGQGLLLDYLDKNAKKGVPVIAKGGIKYMDCDYYVCFFSEFDIIDVFDENETSYYYGAWH